MHCVLLVEVKNYTQDAARYVPKNKITTWSLMLHSQQFSIARATCSAHPSHPSRGGGGSHCCLFCCWNANRLNYYYYSLSS